MHGDRKREGEKEREKEGAKQQESEEMGCACANYLALNRLTGPSIRLSFGAPG